MGWRGQAAQQGSNGGGARGQALAGTEGFATAVGGVASANEAIAVRIALPPEQLAVRAAPIGVAPAGVAPRPRPR
jgi:hypothetical protein